MKQCLTIGTALLVTMLCFSSAQAQETTTDNPHGDYTLELDCSACHTPNGWTQLKDTLDFQHSSDTRFALLGAHEKTTCASCHLDLDFSQPKLENDDCASCHVDVHLGNLSDNCVACHNTVSFKEIDGLALHAETSFPLTGSHLQISCESCHTDDRGGAFTTLETTCVSCHESAFSTTQAPDHIALGFPTNCEQCHTTLVWEDTDYEHALASGGFELVGAHEQAMCASCHVLPGLAPLFTPTDQNDCYTCHTQDYQDEHSDEGFPTTCLECHTNETWDGAEFEHTTAANGFDLVGAHAPLACESCHVRPGLDLVFTPTDQNDCYTCHTQDYNDEHSDEGFSTNCLDCHSNDSWEDFEHAAVANSFDLVGAHAPLACESCHMLPGLELVFTPADQDDCYTCHTQDYNDEHSEDAFPTTCLECHTNETWEGAVFEHATAANGFDLVGAHAPLACESCHVRPGLDLVFTPSDQNDCYTCHTQDYQDEHADEGFSTNCLDCHTNETWEGFEHSAVANSFDLVGAHAPLACESCHTLPGLELVFTPADQDDCYTCHTQDYNDEHSEDAFPTTCLECHTNETWEGAEFEHTTAANGFDLVGAHAPLACESCHVRPGLELVFTPADQNDCYTCHTQDYQDEHADEGFSTNCLDCHTNETWEGFEHSAVANSFDLVGAHAPLACESCHTLPGLELVFTPADQDDCYTCHTQDYNDEHSEDAFPTTCLECHTNETWEGAVFEHATAANGFDLVGAHAPLACESCHVRPGLELVFTPTDQDDCYTCHTQDYNDEHSDEGFSTNCLDCHSNDSWEDFEHAAVANSFDLVGAHAPLACESCHTLPGLAPLFTPIDQNDCYTCHTQDYNDEHSDEGFPTTCLECHTNETWEGAVFEHATAANGFDLVGAHAPLACESCHVRPGLDLVFTPADQNDCYTCHTQDYNDEHSDEGFSTNCLDCHSNDSWEGFEHAAVANSFDLVGAHAPLACESCHTLPGLELVFTPADQDDCYTCHTQDYNDEHSEEGFSTNCLDCHSNDSWEGFEHSAVANSFDLVGAHAPLACESCHTLPGLELVFTPADQDDCYTCHTQDYQDEHSEDAFPTTCLECHTNETWDGAVFEHATAANGFDLVGAHAPLACESCHVRPGLELVFTPADQDDCYTCHTQDYQSEHTGDNFPTTCLTCHTNDTWSDFDHDGRFFPIYTGKHREAWGSCQDCHTSSPSFADFSCLDCHEHRQNEMDDKHKEMNDYLYDSLTCLSCHPDGRKED